MYVNISADDHDVIQAECDGYFLIVDTARHIGNVADEKELLDHIAGCDICS
jgi:hypothetical protein